MTEGMIQPKHPCSLPPSIEATEGWDGDRPCTASLLPVPRMVLEAGRQHEHKHVQDHSHHSRGQVILFNLLVQVQPGEDSECFPVMRDTHTKMVHKEQAGVKNA